MNDRRDHETIHFKLSSGSFDTVSETFLMHIRDVFSLDGLSRSLSAPALRCVDRARAIGSGGTPILSDTKGPSQLRGTSVSLRSMCTPLHAKRL